jgi:hypothetical protein
MHRPWRRRPGSVRFDPSRRPPGRPIAVAILMPRTQMRIAPASANTLRDARYVPGDRGRAAALARQGRAVHVHGESRSARQGPPVRACHSALVHDLPESLAIAGAFNHNFRMSRARKLVLHIGAPKTGTSAIQRFLASNVDALRAMGFDYLRGAPDVGSLPTTGNGLPILLFFENAGSRPEKPSGVLEGYFGTRSTAIISSEILFFLSASGWQELIDACGAIGADPHIIVYLRNVYPFYLSSYNQLVKQHGQTDSFRHFVENNNILSYHGPLHFFAQALGQARVKVAHYESVQTNICRHFLSMISPDADLSKLKFDLVRVNRSLDELELRFVRIANRFPTAHLPGELSNLLISSDPDRHAREATSPEIVELLTVRHAAEVTEINERYFGGCDVLRIADEKDDMRPNAPAGSTSAERLFEWALSRLESARHENLQLFLDAARARALRLPKVMHPDLPPDFDAAGYLVANPDLLMAQVDPYQHYLDLGRAEGRGWRIDGAHPPIRRRTAGDWLDQAIWSVAKLLRQ